MLFFIYPVSSCYRSLYTAQFLWIFLLPLLRNLLCILNKFYYLQRFSFFLWIAFFLCFHSACHVPLSQVFAKCMKSIWRGWIQTVPPLLMTLVSCLTLLMTWRIWAVLCKYDTPCVDLNAKQPSFGWTDQVSVIKYFPFYADTELTLKHISRTTKTGLRRRYTSCCGARLSKQQSQFDKGNYFILYQTWAGGEMGKIGLPEKFGNFLFGSVMLERMCVFVICYRKPFSDIASLIF